MRHSMKRMLVRLWPVLLFLCICVAAYGYSLYRVHLLPYPELAEIQSHGNFNELRDALQDIAKKKGALYAYEILRRAQLPPSTDVHLLGHVIGDELYKQMGESAISYCTDEFRNACSHTVVVGLLLDYGEKALNTISLACQKAPGGVGAYTMCFHGLGHGVLAYENYDLEKTIALCKKTGTAAQHFQEYPQCVGGAIMEIISGGQHSPGIWNAKRPKYLTAVDPLSPCDQSYMPKEVRLFCYMYLTPYLVEAAGGEKNHPDPAVFPKAFSFCRALSENDHNREVCVESFGKEFIGWARQSDPRNIMTLTDEELAQMTSWCNLSGNSKDTYLCLKGIQQFIYWGGENDPRASVRFCSFLGKESQSLQNSCFKDLTALIGRYVPDLNQRVSVCALLPAENKEACIPK